MPLERNQFTNPELCIYVCAVEHVLCGCASILQRRQYGEVCVFASNLCKYDLKKDDLLVLTSLSGEYFFCGVYKG